MNLPTACLCGRTDAKGRPLAYSLCCGPYLDDFEGRPAPDAESLMRSRYSAFVTENGRYLLATWHPDTRPPSIDFQPGLKWLGLEVKSRREIDATHAEVEFVARSKLQGRAHRLHERSRFERIEGRWYYLDGLIR